VTTAISPHSLFLLAMYFYFCDNIPRRGIYFGILSTGMAYRPRNIEERILHRLKITRGHLEKVTKMIKEDQYCIDIINQSRAVQSALREVDYLLLQNHLKRCIVDFIKSGKTKQSVEEIMRIFRNNGKSV